MLLKRTLAVSQAFGTSDNPKIIVVKTRFNKRVNGVIGQLYCMYELNK